MDKNTQIEHVPRTTFFWVMGVFVTMNMAITSSVGSFMYKELASYEDRVETRIARLEERVDSVDDDIRDILVGIEQVKARLGIIESE